MNKNCEKKPTTLSQNILHVVALYNIKRKKYKTVWAELAFAEVTFDRMVMIFYRTCNVFFICYAVILLQYSKSVWWSKVGTLTVYMLISCILIPENCFRSGKSCKMYVIFTFLNWITLYICREYPAYSINIMLCYLFLKFCYLKQKIWIQ